MSRCNMKISKFSFLLSHSAIIVLSFFCVFLHFCPLNCNAYQIKDNNANSGKVLIAENPANFIIYDDDPDDSQLLKSQTNTNGNKTGKLSAEAVREYLRTNKGKMLAMKIKKFVEDPLTRQTVEEQKNYVREIHDLTSQVEKTEEAKKFLEFFENTIESFDGVLPRVRHALRVVFSEDFENNLLIDDPDVEATTFLNFFDILHTAYEDMKKGFTYKRLGIVRRLLRRDLEWNDEEFKKRRGGIIETDLERDIQRMNGKTEYLLESRTSVQNSRIPCTVNDISCDLRKEKCVSDLQVESQGGCSSCWAFATSHAVSISYCFETGILVPFSEQEIIDCSGAECDGGNLYHVANYLATNKHWTDDAHGQYQNGRNRKNPKLCEPQNTPNYWSGNVGIEEQNYIKSSRHLYSSNEEYIKDLKEAIVRDGSLYFLILADRIRNAGTAPLDACQNNNSVSHAMVLVGWDTLDDQQYWIFRNSWGDDFGVNGYGCFYMRCPQLDDSPIWFAEKIAVTSYNEVPHGETERRNEATRGCSAIHRTIHLSCVAPETIDITFTKYQGYSDATNCLIDRTPELKSLCNGKSSCTWSVIWEEDMNCPRQFCWGYNCNSSGNNHTTPTPTHPPVPPPTTPTPTYPPVPPPTTSIPTYPPVPPPTTPTPTYPPVPPPTTPTPTYPPVPPPTTSIPTYPPFPPPTTPTPTYPPFPPPTTSIPTFPPVPPPTTQTPTYPPVPPTSTQTPQPPYTTTARRGRRCAA